MTQKAKATRAVNEKDVIPTKLHPFQEPGMIKGQKYKWKAFAVTFKYCLETKVRDGLNASCEKRSTCYIDLTAYRRSPG